MKVHDADGKSVPHKSGIIIGTNLNPRSYKVKLEDGQTITRNRKQLSVGHHFDDKSCENDIEIQYKKSDKNKNNSINVDTVRENSDHFDQPLVPVPLPQNNNNK